MWHFSRLSHILLLSHVHYWQKGLDLEHEFVRLPPVPRHCQPPRIGLVVSHVHLCLGMGSYLVFDASSAIVCLEGGLG